jgi:legumain
MNYRHQADTCHAYQILKANGVPENQIIHIAYDDIANSRSNPFPGKIFNKPTKAGTEGVDVYDGCKIDYKGNEATAANLISVLKGDKSAKGPVLGSDENSRVFFYFADHGAPGLVAMPVGGYLYADKLNSAVEYMHENKMFKEMTMYMESCESGSMFENILKKDINVYAVSAANSRESSWGAYCSPDDKVNGKSVGACLGDLFSINWMEDSDLGKMSSETLQSQYTKVKAETDKSHVLQWGELTWTSEPVGDFQAGGLVEEKKKDFWTDLASTGKQIFKTAVEWDKYSAAEKNKFAVDSRDIALHYYYTRVMENPTTENHKNLSVEISKRMNVDQVFAEAFPAYKLGESSPANINFECYEKLIGKFEDACFKFDSYSMKFMGMLAKECEVIKAYPEAEEKTMARLTEACAKVTV